VCQARYGLSKDSSVSLVGGRLVSVEMNIVTPWGMYCNLDVELPTVLVR
jgi:hypothetical protein